MKTTSADSLVKISGQLIAVDYISFDWVLASSGRWNLTNRE
jgi:hypothetical protein